METSCWKCITVQFGGGCELLFNKETSKRLEHIVPVGSTINDLIVLLKQQYIKERSELFVDATGTTIRPGILTLVNGCDAEVHGGLTCYILEEGDEVEFISTLHGG